MSLKYFTLWVLPCVMSFGALCQTPVNDKNWNSSPTFNDNFNPQTFGPSYTWKTVTGNYPTGFCFSSQMDSFNSSILLGNSVLQLKAAIHSPRCDTSRPIYSGGIISNGQFEYGYYEISCELNYSGKWENAAFWMAGFDCSIPEYNELDCEILSNQSSPYNPLYFTHSLWDTTGACANGKGLPAANNQPYTFNVNVQNSFHKYAFEWTPDHVIWYFDGTPIQEVTNGGYNAFYQVPNLPMNIWLDLGFQATDTTHHADSILQRSTYPAYMYVDYINQYDLKSDCSTDYSTCSFNINTFPFKVYHSITLTGSCNDSIPIGKTASFRASDHIEINCSFKVHAGAQLIMIPTQCY